MAADLASISRCLAIMSGSVVRAYLSDVSKSDPLFLLARDASRISSSGIGESF